MSPVRYTGLRRSGGEGVVYKHVDDLAPQELNLRSDLRQHADGPNWGYGGGGPRQLALALLADVLGDESALELSNRFKWQVVAGFPREGFSITAEAIEQWASEIESKEKP